MSNAETPQPLSDDAILTDAQRTALRRRLSDALNDFGGPRNVLVELARILYVDSMQLYERMSDIPDIDRDIINLGCSYDPARNEPKDDDLF